MIKVVKFFLQTNTVVIGIAIIGLIGYGIKIIMRFMERRLNPLEGQRLILNAPYQYI